jgi:hypothetical protein
MSINLKVENVLREILSAVQLARIYSFDHPKLKDVFGQACSQLQEILEIKPELIIGIVGQELAFENEIFFELSKRAGQVTRYLKE